MGATEGGERVAEEVGACADTVRRAPERVDGHLRFGLTLARAGHPEAARRVLEHAEHLDPRHPRTAEALAELGLVAVDRLDPQIGTVLHGVDGDYAVHGIMRGGQGAVLRVELLPGTAGALAPGTYALKTFQAKRLGRTGERDRFAREMRTWVSLKPHPHVLPALSVERVDGVPGLVTDFLPEGDLARRIGGRPVPVVEALRLVVQLCSALEHSHSRGIAHGDVKPANCLLADDGALLLTDFGLAQPFGESPDEFVAFDDEIRQIYHRPLGDPTYQAPEQVRAGGSINAKTDVYSLGVVLYEMLSGRRPANGGVALAHMRADPPEQALPDGLVGLLHDCVAPEPADRPANVRMVGRMLEDFYRALTGGSAPRREWAAPDPGEATLRRGIGMVRLGESREGATMLGWVLDKEPRNSRAAVHLAPVLVGLGRGDDALDRLHAVLDHRPDDPGALTAAALVLLASGDAHAASGLLDGIRASANLPSHLRAAVGVARARVLLALGRPAEARSELDRVLGERPRDVDGLRWRGRAHGDLERYGAARRDLDDALRIDPTSTDTACERGRALVGLGRMGEGLEALDRGVGAELDQPGRRRARARALQALDRNDEALADAVRACELDPDDEGAVEDRADLLRTLGRPEEARVVIADAERRAEKRAAATDDGGAPSDPAGRPGTRRETPGAPTVDPGGRPNGPGDGGGPPPGETPVPGEPSFSVAVGLALALARLEATAGGSTRVTPAHVLLGAAKLCDTDLTRIRDVAHRELAEIERESLAVRSTFEEGQVDLTRFRRGLRRLVAEPGAAPVHGTPRRTDRARGAFTGAGRIAARAGSRVTLLEHLVEAVLPIVVDGRAEDPAECLTVLAAAVERTGNAVPVADGAAAGRRPAPDGLLERWGRDLTELARGGRLGPVVGRDDDIRLLAGTLVKARKSNPLLLGEPGVGKTAVVEGLAIAITGASPPAGLRGTRVVELSLTSLVAGTTHRGEFEERLQGVIAEAGASDDIVLFIDEVHTVLGAGGAVGGMDAANILKPALARGDIRLIGATTEADHRRYVEKDAALLRRFQTIRIAEPTEEEATRMLRGVAGRLEEHHGVRVTDEAVASAVSLSCRHLPELHLPDKAIDLLDEACAFARPDPPVRGGVADGEGPDGAATADAGARAPQVGADEVLAVTAVRCGIPVERLRARPGARLGALADELGARVIGQPEAVEAVTGAVLTLYAGLSDPGRPACVLLFAGPPGTGKTLLATALAEALAGSRSGLVHIDLAEYGEPNSVSRLLGAPPGYVGHDAESPLLGKVRANPHAVVLFDDVDHAHPAVLEALMPVLDRGVLTDGAGRTVSFARAIVVLTVRADLAGGRGLGFGASSGGDADAVLRRAVRPDLLGSLSAVVPFRRFDADAVRRIVDLKVDGPRRRLAAHGLSLVVDESAYAEIQAAADTRSGARGLDAAVDRIVTRPIAATLVDGPSEQDGQLRVAVVDGAPRVTHAPVEDPS